ncbi:ATP-binding protein [Hujiaoplasma nucleasis]|uniref:ATP-binding protein n=1 Tax=Hujiaoplasma nucleasis TaxID=2725268 RepID=A0A7L6N5G6_9MOLU|nr:ATP-binding protein [Hujiaoplasma nucleasis]QLY40245.1 ATP-binding protein [Hujiaoplasma nucleasis]
MIKRIRYLNILNNYKDKPIIKILTGLRRVGKSVLLDLFINELLESNVKKEHILKLNFELPEHFDIQDYKDLSDRVISWSEGKQGNLYVFLDEVGRVKDWEKAVNGFHTMDQFDIYVTGSNADLLSSDLSTYLAGRYIEILVHPFSFKEFRQLKPNASLNDYITYGGMPSIAAFDYDYEISMNVLRDSFNSAVLQDVIHRNKIRNSTVLEKLIEYVFNNTGKTFSALSISKYFKSQRISVSVDTILNYLKVIRNAFLIYKVRRNDLMGKLVLKTEEKYYIADHGIREAIVGNNEKVIEMILENMVYVELLRRGYTVYIGKVNEQEIDFVAKKGKNIKYYQVSYLLETDKTRNREFGVYEHIKDNFEKYVLSMDKIDFSQSGIIHKNIEDFLLE